MTTPKEELLADMDKIVREWGASRQETRATIKRYAVGQWVSVEERLPDRETTGEWRGYAMFMNGEVDIVTWYHYQTSKDITHWLELDLPEVDS